MITINDIHIGDIVSTDKLKNIKDIYILIADYESIKTKTGENALKGKVIFVTGISDDVDYEKIFNENIINGQYPAVFYQPSYSLYNLKV